MNVSVTFEPSGISGLVAQGTYLIDAAKRLGAPLGSQCKKGTTACEACVVSVKSGNELLSTPSDAEQRLFGTDADSGSLRLLCQTKIEGQGEIVLMSTVYHAAEATFTAETQSDIAKKFNQLPLKEKIAALLKFEAITVQEVIDTAIQKPLNAGSKVFESFVAKARAARSEKSTTK